MTMRATHDVVVTTGIWNDNGKDKKKYSNVGTLFTDDQTGRMSMKLTVTPMPKIGKEGFPEVWLSFFQKDKSRQQGGFQQPPLLPPPPQNQIPEQFIGASDDIPF